MSEKKTQFILKPIEKKRYQFSSEYFSKGAALELKNKFNNFQIKGIDKTIGKLKKQKEDDDEKKKFKFGIKTKILLLSGLLVSGVVLFDKLNDLFPKQDKKSEDKTKQQIEYNLDDQKLMKSTGRFNALLKDQYTEGFKKPLLDNLTILTTNNPSTLGEELTAGLNSSQKLHNGVIGQVFYNVSLAAIWHTFARRGYEFILRAFNFPHAEDVYFNVGMWKQFAADPTQYGHVGRDLVNNSIKGAQIVEEAFDEGYLANNNYILQNETNWLGILTSWGTDGPFKIINNFNFILEQLSQSRDVLQYARLKDVHLIEGVQIKEVKKAKIVGYKQSNTMAAASGSISTPIWQDYYEIEGDYTWTPFSDYIDDWEEFDDGGLPPTVIKTPKDFTIFNKSWDYVYDVFKFNEINGRLKDLYEFYKQFITSTGDRDKFWSFGKLSLLVQISYYVAEWELYQALQSINATRGLYVEFFKRQESDVLVSSIAQREKELRTQAEDFQIAYAKGQLTLEEVISEIKKGIQKIKGTPLKWIKNDINLHRNVFQKQIPYEKIKESVREIKREIIRGSVKGVKDSNLLILDNTSLRDNFDLKRRANVDTNERIKGQQFGSKFLGSEPVYSNHPYAKNYGIAPYYKVAYWWGVWRGGRSLGSTKNSAPPGRGFGGDLIFYGWKTYDNGEEYKRSFQHDEKYTAWALTAYNHGETLLSKSDPNDLLYTESIINVAHGTKHYKSYDYVVMYQDYYGIRNQNIFETFENGNFYLLKTWEYFDKNGDFVGYEEIEKKPSLKSHAAIYQGEYERDELDKLYALPLEVLERNLKATADYVEEQLLEVYTERAELISKIMEKTEKTEIKDDSGNVRVIEKALIICK